MSNKLEVWHWKITRYECIIERPIISFNTRGLIVQSSETRFEKTLRDIDIKKIDQSEGLEQQLCSYDIHLKNIKYNSNFYTF